MRQWLEIDEDMELANERSPRVNVAQRMWLLTILTLHLLANVQVNHGMPTEEAVPVSVNRRQQSPDILVFTNSSHHRNCYANTYLVDERRCVDNQVLHDACRFAISLRQNPSSYRITLFINDQGQFQSSVVVMTYEVHRKAVNNSLCHISNLEVYRGREQAIEISHDGFSLTENGTINVNQSSLAYSVVEFVGELYRMNLSCSGGGLPESGCLFFKVGGKTNLTRAKFDERVPGTFQTQEDDTLITTVTVGAVSSTTQLTTDHEMFSYPQSFNSSTVSTTHSSTRPSSATATTDLTIYVTIAAAGGVATLLLVVILLCIVFIYCAMTNKTNTATANNNTKDAVKDQGQLEQSNEASAPPLRNLWCEQSDMMSVIPINFPMRQTIPVLTDNNPVYTEVDFMNEAESPRALVPPTDYHNNPAYMHFTARY